MRDEIRFLAFTTGDTIWPYGFEVRDPSFEYEMRPVLEWCKDNFGPPWNSIMGERSTWCRRQHRGAFVFRDQSHALAFRVRWT